MSTTTAATMDSRSSSPETPETSDGPHNVAIHNDRELPTWYHASRPGKNISVIGAWDGDAPFVTLQKPEVERMLQLDDLIEEHAYDDSPCSGIENPPLFSQPLSDALHSEIAAPADGPWTSPQASPQESQLYVPPQSQMRCTPVVPPPAVRPRKRDPTTPHRVVHPSRESCYNLTIVTPNIPESGAKSRVETQVRVSVDLAHASSSSGEQHQYDRVGSWKWLKLPPGTPTKKRTRREGKIDPAPLDILHLTATVTCASAPHNRVVSCGSCRNREAKRVARKLAARIRPARSDSDTPEDGREHVRSIKEDTTSIIQFNCPEVLDFSTGSAVLPVRITCYCRHHREKVGFHIHFTMMDHNGRIIGTGMTPPIMITDDHKSTIKSGVVPFNPLIEAEVDWSRSPQAEASTDNGAPSKRTCGNGKGQLKKRAKPYDLAGRSNPVRFSREASVASLSSSVNSPSMQPSTSPNTRSPTPSHLPQPLSPLVRDSAPALQLPTLTTDAESILPSFSSNGRSSVLGGISGAAVFSSPNGISTISTKQLHSSSDTHTPPVAGPTPQPSQLLSTLVPPRPMPFMFFNPGSPPPIMSLPVPRIHRLIPASGPTHGGIEVTILGENFHPAIQFNCVFGDVVASSTQRWSDNTLLCVLPPRSTPGVVAVWFEGFDNTKNSSLPSLFTYTDESDRALMELALQVVGLKMTGKIEDAKNVALRIVGTTGTEESQPNSGADNMMQVASSSYDDIRPLLFLRSGERDNYEVAIVKFMSLIDLSVERQSNIPMKVAVSHATSSGQTLLHLAVFLKFASLTEFLITHDIDLDARDRNGYTALHCAVLAQSRECAKLLVDAGADLEIVNALGRTPQDISPADFFEGIIDYCLTSESDVSPADDDDGESRWGDVETDEDWGAVIVKRKRAPRVTRRRSNRRAHDCDKEPGSETSHASQPQEAPTKAEDTQGPSVGDTADEKQAASFVDMIQRTLAQLHAAPGIIPNMPQLPLPNLPEMPTVPWGALPQIPMVFPVFVPMSIWPSFLSDKRGGPRDEDPNNKDGGDARPIGYSAARTAQELRATWEKWMTLAVATATLRPPPAEEAPPMYTPRETQEETTVQQLVGSPSELQEADPESTTKLLNALDRPNRRVGYEVTSMPAQDVDAYGYVPVKAHTQKSKKHDRMLVLFWLPILLMSLLWAFHNGIRFAVHALKTTLSVKAGVRA
ncbi:hypothetical protein BS17DRAFT_747806 [Gyrodon lividus]|nr:hypothetical protein BS17DRAFT_747806 [Gyrodon lividus]